MFVRKFFKLLLLGNNDLVKYLALCDRNSTEKCFLKYLNVRASSTA